MSNTLDIDINQGEDFRRVITIKDDTGSLVDLTGYTFRGQVRQTYTSSSTIASFEFTIKNQVTYKGQADWHLPNTSLVGLSYDAPVKYLYDVEMVYPSGDVKRILQGKAKINPEVTK